MATGERVLASCASVDGVVLAGTRDALLRRVRARARVPWEQVEAADWDSDDAVFRVSVVGSWGEEQVAHSYGLTEPGRLLELVRERVTASIVLQRHVPVAGRRGRPGDRPPATARGPARSMVLRVRRGGGPRRSGRP